MELSKVENKININLKILIMVIYVFLTTFLKAICGLNNL